MLAPLAGPSVQAEGLVRFDARIAVHRDRDGLGGLARGEGQRAIGGREVGSGRGCAGLRRVKDADRPVDGAESVTVNSICVPPALPSVTWASAMVSMGATSSLTMVPTAVPSRMAASPALPSRGG